MMHSANPLIIIIIIIKLCSLVTESHVLTTCPRLLAKAEWPGVESVTYESQLSCPNNYTTGPHATCNCINQITRTLSLNISTILTGI